MTRPFRSVLLVAFVGTFVAAACQSGLPTVMPSADRTQPLGSASASAPAPTSTLPASPSVSPQPTASPGKPTPRLASIAVTLEPFARVPGGPLAMTAPDDGTGRLLVAAQDGKIWALASDGTVATEPMLDIGSLISSGGERGLLGIAAHPGFPTDPRVFLNYTNTEGDSIVASAALDPDDPDRLDPGTLTKILFVKQPFPNHNGGSVQFGPDGKLYLSFGDGGSGGDPQGNGQKRTTLLGKILRIDIDRDVTAEPYLIPADNPYAGGGGLPEIWHWGLRNPWRMSFDRATGDLWIGDVGQNSYEEVDVARRGTSNLNFGWNIMEGSHCFSAKTCDEDGLTLPVSDYGRTAGCTVIGGYAYRGTRYPFLVGTYLFSDYCTGAIFALDAASDSFAPPVVVGAGVGGGGTSAFGQDATGELYVMRLSGEVLRVVARER